jgi:hypothetical protein
VWHPQLWGSWLELAVPDLRYTADSRIELFPPDLWTDVNTVNNTNGEWMSALERYDVDVIVVEWEQVDLYDGLAATGDWFACAVEGEGWVWLSGSGRVPPVGCDG